MRSVSVNDTMKEEASIRDHWGKQIVAVAVVVVVKSASAVPGLPRVVSGDCTAPP
jgi:hypothetical protein